MSKHTPGPWSYSADFCSECRKLGRSEYVINEVPGGNHGQVCNEADAALIAAAPELFEACMAALALFNMEPGDATLAMPSVRKAVVSALSKATIE